MGQSDLNTSDFAKYGTACQFVWAYIMTLTPKGQWAFLQSWLAGRCHRLMWFPPLGSVSTLPPRHSVTCLGPERERYQASVSLRWL